MKHKWHKEIKAWADGAEIEHKWKDAWYVSSLPKWSDDVEYRIKPQPLSHETIETLWLENEGTVFKFARAIEKAHGIG
jgi:hypothetical protein